MKISMQAVQEELNALFRVIECKIFNEGNFISNVLFMDGGMTASEGTLFICLKDEQAVLPVPPNSAAIFFKEIPEEFRHADVNYIVLDDGALPAAVLNCLQDLFSRLRAWEKEAYDILISGKGLQALFNSALRILHNPLYLHDKTYRIIVYSEDRSNPSMKKTYDFLDGGKMTPQAILGLTRSPDFEKTFDQETPAYWKKTSIYPDEYNYLYCNVRNGSEFVGRIFVDERVRPFRYADYSILEKLSQLVAQIFQVNRSFADNNRSQLKVLLTNLLDGYRVSAQQISSELRELNWDSQKQYLCFAVRLKDSQQKYNISDSICCLLQQQFEQCCAFQYEHYITGVIGAAVSDRARSQICSQIELIFRDYHLKVGVSLPFAGILEIVKYYHQALTALEIGRKQDPENLVHFFADYTFDFLLHRFWDNHISQDLYPKGLPDLLRYDRENDTDYVTTLRAYLEHHCSPAQATKALFIHRSTFLYRLEKITEITNINFDDLRTRLHYLLVFQLMDLDEKAGS